MAPWIVVLLGVLALGILTVGALSVRAGREIFAAGAGMPGLREIEVILGPPGSGELRPTLLFDRTGEVLLAELGHPLAADRTYQTLDRLPPYIGQAFVAALDPSFLAREEQGWRSVAALALRVVASARVADDDLSLSERLVRQTLLPADAARVVSLVLASDLESTYSRPAILEWFLNSADFGNLAVGIDSASLVYFGKHADELTLGEAAALAGALKETADPLQEPGRLRALASQALEAMRQQGMISAQDASSAASAPLTIQVERAGEALTGLGFLPAVWAELQARLGAGPSIQGGARVITTLDLDLQLQADCVVRTHLARMSGESPTVMEPAVDGSPCVAASFLPPLRPGDVGIDHRLERAALVATDPRTGEVLALVGPALEPVPSGGSAAPFIYLGALARGYTPATMLSVPRGADLEAGADLMRLRTALVGGTAAATREVMELVGVEAAVRTMDQLGLEVPLGGDTEGGLAAGELPLRPMEIAGALGALANGGIQAGVWPTGSGGASPTLVQSVLNADGDVIFERRFDRRAVVSEGLAYLLTDVLADETARWPRLGQGNLLEVGRPAAATVGDAYGDRVHWALGYTPQRAVVVWTGSAPGESLTRVNALNGAVPIWHAVLRFASRDLPPEAWDRPADVTEVAVCDPSGFLATPFCPRVVEEIFLLGTEPTASDTLYRPFRINRETGRLATFFTPLDLVEEKVYFVPPSDAGPQVQEGAAAPPVEYDRILPPAILPGADIVAPGIFDVVSGVELVRGSAEGDSFSAFRLDVGAGLDPQAWFQIGEEGTTPVHDGVLGRWDTRDLEGLQILRLTVVNQDGTVETAAVPVTVDNKAPRVSLTLPLDGQVVKAGSTRDFAIEAEVSDGSDVVRVVFYVDDRAVATRTLAPWSMRWPIGAVGEHVVRARATDAAGNSADSDEVRITVER